MKKKYPPSGFTLVEIMIVVVVIGLLAALAVPAFSTVRRRAFAKIMINDARQIGAAMQIIATENAGIPSGSICTITITPTGLVSSTEIPYAGGTVPADTVSKYVRIIGRQYTLMTIPYTFNETGTAFSMQSSQVAPVEVNPSSTINVSTEINQPVAFDAEGKVR
jgi:type IV pilus assembly protein PilA